MYMCGNKQFYELIGGKGNNLSFSMVSRFNLLALLNFIIDPATALGVCVLLHRAFPFIVSEPSNE